MTGRLLSLALCALCTFLAGCSSSGAPAPVDAGPSQPATTLCSTDTRAQTFAPGLEGTSKTGPLDIKLVTVAPAPPVKGSNEWTITVADASGNPVDGLDIGVVPYMPDHRHGSSITPTVTPVGSGKYDVTLLDLAMPGIWTVTVSVRADGGVEASAVFTFCIEG